MKEQRPALGRMATGIGVFCVVGLTLLIVDMTVSLAFLPEDWLQPPAGPLSPFQFDLREMRHICPGPIGWLGAWGYLISWLWLPYAVWRAVRGSRSGVSLRRRERILLVVAPLQILAVQLLLRATPLRHAYPLV